MTPLLGILLLLAASVGWSGLDLLRKVLVAKIAPLPLLFYLTAGMVPLFAVWVWVDGRTELPAAYWAPALGSVLLNIIANLAFFESIRLSPLSLTIPLLSFTPVFATVLAVFFVGEVPRWLQVGGILLVVGGALVLSVVPGEASLGRVARSFLRDKGALLMLLVSLSWAAAISFDKQAITAAGEPLHALVLSLAIGVATLGMLAARRRLKELGAARRAPGTLVASLVLGSVSLGLQLVALQVVLVSLVETLKRGIGNALAVVWGRIFFAEEITSGKVIGVLLMALGVALVLMG